MEDSLIIYGYSWNEPSKFWQSSNKYLPDIDVDFKTIHYQYGPDKEKDCYIGGQEITSAEDLDKLIKFYKNK